MTARRAHDGWDAVAAPGTDPVLLARTVAWLLGPRHTATRLLKQAVAAGAEDPAEALPGLVGDPGPAALELAGGIGAQWHRLGVRVALVGDPAYPHRLAAGWPHTGGPVLLAWRGPAAGIGERPAVALVGARRATAYGTGVAAWLAEAASDAGVLVVSGGAVGVDAAAHGAALPAQGGTAVVLGCGHGVAYPRRHAAPGGLFDRVLDRGGWIASELLPEVAPTPPRVRERNRIVAGLSDVVVVVEGGRRSGSLITAAAAADRGVTVMAVPGDVRRPGSAAPHRLLAEGAAPCTSPDDLLAALGRARTDGPGAPDSRDAPAAATSTLPAAVHAVLAERWPRPIRSEALAEMAGIAAPTLLAALTRARIAGEIAESMEGVRLVRAPS